MNTRARYFMKGMGLLPWKSNFTNQVYRTYIRGFLERGIEMTTLNQLEALAKAANKDSGYGRHYMRIDPFIVLTLIELVRQQHESMLAVLCDPEGTPCFDGSNGDREVIAEALAAFENFGVEK